MATQVTMPVLGLTMEEGTVAEWLKQEGDSVAKDEPLLTVEMDKGTVEVPSPAAGVLRRIVVQPGTTVPVKTLIAEIGEAGELLVSPAAPQDPSGPGDLPAPAAPRDPSGPGDLPSPAAPQDPSGPGDLPSRAGLGELAGGPTGVVDGGRVFASPRARMRARTLGIQLIDVRGTGPLGRIVEADVLGAHTPATRMAITPVARHMAQERGVDLATVQGSGPGGRITQDDVLRTAEQTASRAAGGEAGGELEVPASAVMKNVRPLTRVRRITAERMAASAHSTARVTLFLDADFSEASRFRHQLQPEFARLGVPRLPWDALIARAAALALAEHPTLLSQWVDGEGLREPTDINIGVGVALEPEGLVVPVLKAAASRSLRELAADLLSLVDKARAGRLGPADMQSSAFTITNLGAYRVDGFTPILNPPETAILGVGRIADKPVVVEGAIAVRTLCTLSLSFDHRVVDGAPAAAFLARLAELLERPYALLGI